MCTNLSLSNFDFQCVDTHQTPADQWSQIARGTTFLDHLFIVLDQIIHDVNVHFGRWSSLSHLSNLLFFSLSGTHLRIPPHIFSLWDEQTRDSPLSGAQTRFPISVNPNQMLCQSARQFVLFHWNRFKTSWYLERLIHSSVHRRL